MKLTRRSALTAVGGALSLPFVRPSWAQSTSLNVYNWADYIGENTIAEFESETGISVVYDLYSSTEEAEAKMLAGSSGYDVVLQSGLSLPLFTAAGVYEQLDRSRFKNYGNLDPAILKVLEGFDPGNAYALPYMWGTVGFTFNMDLVRERLPDADLASMDTIFLPENAAKLADCGLTLLDSPKDIGLMVLSWLGIDPNTAGPAEYAKMSEAFAAIRPYIRTFDNTNYLTTLPNSEVCVANTWSGDYGVAKTRAAEAGIDIKLEYFVPKSGVPAWFDNWVITAKSPNLDNAYLFLDYMMRPEVIAACTNYTGYANANLAATALVDPAITSDPGIYPNAEILGRMYTPKPLTAEQEREITRAWTQIKAG